MLLVGTSVNAEYLGSLGSVDSAVFRQLNVPLSGNDNITTTVVMDVVNRAMQQLCYDAPAFEKQDTVVGGTNASSRFYDLNNDFISLNSVVKFSGDTATLPLGYKPVSDIWEIRGGLAGAMSDYHDEALPRYAWVYNRRLALYPMSVSADTFVVSYYAVCAELDAATDSIEILEGFRDAIVDYSCYLLSMRGGLFQQAEAYYTAYLRKTGKVSAGQ